MIVNFTGQPETGKTTLSNQLRSMLKTQYPNYNIVILDGDVIRDVTNNKDYSELGRRKNISNAYSIAGSILDASKIDKLFKSIVIIALISPYLDLREKLKSEYPVLEIHLETSVRKSREQYNVIGYEKPVMPFMYFKTDDITPYSCCFNIIKAIDLFLTNL